MVVDDSPLWESFLFEQPWPLALVLLLAAVIVWVTMRWRGRGWTVLSGGLVVAGIAVMLLAALVTTQREHLRQRTRELVDRATKADIPAVTALLDDRAVLAGPDGSTWLTRDAFLLALQNTVNHYKVSNAQVNELLAEARDEQIGLTQFELRTTVGSSTYGSYPIKSRWLIVWTRDDDSTWRVWQIHWQDHEDPNGLKPTQGIWR